MNAKLKPFALQALLVTSLTSATIEFLRTVAVAEGDYSAGKAFAKVADKMSKAGGIEFRVTDTGYEYMVRSSMGIEEYTVTAYGCTCECGKGREAAERWNLDNVGKEGFKPARVNTCWHMALASTLMELGQRGILYMSTEAVREYTEEEVEECELAQVFYA